MTKKLIVFLLLVLFVMQVIMVEAASINDVQQELEQAQKDLENLKDKLDNNNAQQKATANQLSQLTKQLQDTEKQINGLETQMVDLNTSIVEHEKQVEQAITDLNYREGLLAGRVQAIYKYSSLSYVSILFNADSLADFLSRFTMMRKLISVDKGLISEIQTKRDALEAEKTALLEEKQILEIQRQTIEYRKSEYQTRSAQRSALMRKLESDEVEYEKALKELEKSSKELEERLRELANSAVLGTGVMKWPTPGYIWVTSPFGYRIHPITRKRSMHTGIDIGVPYGKDICAADSGTVVYSGGYGGYGLVVIINHGNGKTTLYAHNSKLLVKEGQAVAKGQPVARCGTSGLSTGPHLHFEVRVNGQPTNPLDHVKKSY